MLLQKGVRVNDGLNNTKFSITPTSQFRYVGIINRMEV